MLEELENIISYIIVEHKKSNESWRRSNQYFKINFNKVLVKEVVEAEILEHILEYREFININNIELMNELKYKFSIGNTKIENRVKVKNSVEDKIKNYNTEKHEFGEVPLDKCLNDLFRYKSYF